MLSSSAVSLFGCSGTQQHHVNSLAVLFAENTLLPDLYRAPFLTSARMLPEGHLLGEGVPGLPLQRHHPALCSFFRTLTTVEVIACISLFVGVLSMSHVTT